MMTYSRRGFKDKYIVLIWGIYERDAPIYFCLFCCEIFVYTDHHTDHQAKNLVDVANRALITILWLIIFVPHREIVTFLIESKRNFSKKHKLYLLRSDLIVNIAMGYDNYISLILILHCDLEHNYLLWLSERSCSLIRAPYM